MPLHSVSTLRSARRSNVRRRLVLLWTVAALVLPSLSLAQTEAPGEAVVIPGTTIPGWGQVDTVPGRFGRPTSSPLSKSPAVLILHGGGGVDGRGAFYAKALQEAGITTLEITMFPPGSTPGTDIQATMPHAAAALTWLAAQPPSTGSASGSWAFPGAVS